MCQYNFHVSYENMTWLASFTLFALACSFMSSPKQNTLPLLTNSIQFPLSLFYLQCLFLNLEYCTHVGPSVCQSVFSFRLFVSLNVCHVFPLPQRQKSTTLFRSSIIFLSYMKFTFRPVFRFSLRYISLVLLTSLE